MMHCLEGCDNKWERHSSCTSCLILKKCTLVPVFGILNAMHGFAHEQRGFKICLESNHDLSTMTPKPN